MIILDRLGFDKYDERWVGAWWLPYLIAAVWLALVVLPLGGFPNDLPGIYIAQNVKSSISF